MVSMAQILNDGRNAGFFHKTVTIRLILGARVDEFQGIQDD